MKECDKVYANPGCGIYKITNELTNECYVGKSVAILSRWASHKREAYRKKSREYNKALYRAFRKYGIDKFKFEVIEECDEDKLIEREIYYIEYYEAYTKGYNETKGGEVGFVDGFQGEKHPNHKLTKKDVIEIRERYNNRELMEDVYKDYKERIGKDGFKKVFYGRNWKGVSMEVYTEENKKYHANKALSRPGIKNGRNVLTEDEKADIIRRLDNGELGTSIHKDYKDKITIARIYGINKKENKIKNSNKNLQRLFALLRSRMTISTSFEIGGYRNIQDIVRAISNGGLHVGEINPEELAETTLNPEKRDIIKVTIDDLQSSKNLNQILFGGNPDKRKNFIQERI